MTHGMVREVDRIIGALSTVCLGVGLLVLRELYRSVRDNQVKWERCHMDEGGKDVYYHTEEVVIVARCGEELVVPALDWYLEERSLPFYELVLVFHAVDRFMIRASKSVEAFDDSNTFSCKKGRFPLLIVPTSCFEMMESSDVSLYESRATSCQHVFCAKCGVHIFQFDHTQPDCVAVNMYCVEDENFEDIKIIFIPRGARPLFGPASGLPLPSEQPYRRPLQSQGFDTVREDSEEATIAFQKQMMMWARMDTHEKYHELPSDDTQSSTSSTSQTRTRRFSFASSEDTTIVTKDQLEFYLKRHLDDPSPEEFRV